MQRFNRKLLLVFVSFFMLFSILVVSQSSYANGSVSALVDTEWLAANLSNTQPVYVGFVGGDDKAKYDGKHIAGSVYISMGDLMGAMTATPNKANFEALMGKVGVSNDSHVVLYSTPAANPFVPGAYWLLKYFGHAKVSILNGSMDKWSREGRAVTGDATNISVTTYSAAKEDASILALMSHVKSNIKNSKAVVVDTRGAAEFSGQDKKDYIKSAGHIPGALNMNFYPSNRNGDGTYKSAAEIKKAYEAAGITTDKEIITYCEGGPRAADAYFALKELAGYPNVQVYVGSWMEWANDESNPVEK